MSLELLDFYADWCGPCQIMKPALEEFETAHPELKITRVNIDENEELAEKYGVSSIPCLVFLKDSEETARQIGVTPLKKLEKILEKING